MPIYALVCPKCKDRWEDYHPIRAPHPLCRKGCRKRCETDPGAQMPRRERQFCGSQTMSLQFGFDASEAEEARRDFDGTGATIKDSGDVHFDNRSQERAFRKRYKQIEDAHKQPASS